MLMHLSLATFLTSLLRRVNRAKRSAVFSQFVYFILCVCGGGAAIRKPDLLGSDLLFFTSPTYQPPASVAVKRNGWYFRGELLFPFLASIFLFQRMSKVRVALLSLNVSNHKFRPSWRRRSCSVCKAQCPVCEDILHVHLHLRWAEFMNQNSVSGSSGALSFSLCS